VAAAEPASAPAPCTAIQACLDKADAARNGRGMEPDRSLAVRAYEKACELGDPRGCLEAARIYRRGWMFEVDRKPDRARDLAGQAVRKSSTCNGSDQCVIGFDAQLLQLELGGWQEQQKSIATKLWSDADKLCDKSPEACRWIRERGFAFSDHSYVDRNTVVAVRDRAAATLETQCKRNSTPAACYLAAQNAKSDEAAMKLYEPACKANYKDSCWEFYEAKIDSTKTADTPVVIKEALAALEPMCATTPLKQCRELGELYLLGIQEANVKIPKDTAKGERLIERTCAAGDVRACETLGKIFYEGKLIRLDLPKAKSFWGRGCRLSEPDDSCALCEKFPQAAECKLRSAWFQTFACEAGDENACAAVGDAFRGKTGELKDHARSAKYYRRACDAAVKTACASLDEMCQNENDLDAGLCQQSLIHSDLFYEAEWQYRQTGKAEMAGGADTRSQTNDKVAGLDQPESSSGGPGGGGFKRGSLDADLVVGIVLDRARQAAIQVVVDELQDVGGARVAGYLRDLLAQAALLLGDRNTLRREKLTDLARTVVRALLASNLVNTLYPDVDALVDAPIFQLWNGKPWKVKWSTGDKERLRRYLTDWAYSQLGQTKLFDVETDYMPRCPFGSNPGKQVCGWLVKDGKPDMDHLRALLHLNTFVDGLSLARTIRLKHEVDLRRLIEALGRSKTIANFTSTPGLNLQVWERELVTGIEDRLRDLRDQTDAIAKLADPATFQTPPPWSDILNWGRTARRVLVDRGAAALLSRDQQARISELSRIITTAIPIGVAPGTQGETDEQRASRISAELVAKINQWEQTTRTDLMNRVSDLRRRITAVRPMLTNLSRQIEEIKGAVRRLSRGGLAIDEVPLSGLAELNEPLDGALTELRKLDEQLRSIFPGTRRTQVRFAISALVRLRGFLSLMDRISRSAPLNQTVGELMSSVKMLGNFRNGRFSAPLFDVVEPVLDALQTHRPLDADVLFSMIARARLDSLITSLDADPKRRPCEREESGTECWTVKVIHALQESVQRDGEIIKVDGGVFARRLAVHGDDFRKKHKWGSFFHLTVGFGGMYSKNPPEMDASGNIIDGKARTVPLVSEQIGFGIASPTFWGDKLTYKLGVYGSGILYRMVLDSTESNAVALGAFMAIDIHNYVELFVAPAVLLYPPEGERSITPRLAASVGLSVPLGAYLEKLTD
jgi:TPR repeat protein